MKVAAHHIESLDVFRGVTVAAMMLVNNPGDWSAVFPQLVHAYWTGWTFADLVFPWFIFAMGVAMPFAFARRRDRGHALHQIYRRIVRRVMLLVALGLILNAVAAWPVVVPLRFPGVLQRIALAYLVAALVVLHSGVTGWALAAALLMLAHWLLLAFVPFAGFPAGTLTPEHNFAKYIDTIVFGRHVLAIPNDPEGLIGTMPAAATALIGALTGHVLRQTSTGAERMQRLLAGGVVALLLGVAWSAVLPVSKPLWTGSFVGIACGLGILVLAAVYFVVDLRHFRSWGRPFLWLGVNPLAVYFLSEIVGHRLEGTTKSWLFWSFVQPFMRPLRPEWASLAFGLAFVAVWIVVAGLLYQRRIRIQV